MNAVSEPYSMTSRMKSLFSKAAFVLALAAAIYHLQLIVGGIPEAYRFRSMHLFFLLPLVFLVKPIFSERRKWLIVIDAAFIFLSFYATYYLTFKEYAVITERIPAIDELTSEQLIIGSLFVLTVLEGARRVVGMGMIFLCVVAILYTMFGNNISGAFYYSGSTFTELVDKLVFTTDGIFSIPLAAAATFIFLFVLFGKFLERSGAGALFIELAFALAGRSRGGPAKIAVLSSAFMGSISGSATANVVSTGAYTIPLMKKAGYTNNFSAAVESAASTGGQLLPPVMGAAAFLLADFVGIPYTSLIVIAALPASLFFTGIFASVHFESIKLNLKGVDESEIPVWSAILKRSYLLLPLVIVVTVLFMGYTPYFSATIALISVVLIASVHSSTRMSIKQIIMTLADGTKDAVMISITCAAAGIIIGVASETGLGVKFASIVLSAANDNLFILLFFTMLASLVLGMGLPTSAAYILIIAIAAPALIKAGVQPIAAHLFILYFGVFSAITPPVAISSYAAAGLAASSPMKTSLIAFRLSIPAFIVPYLFVYHRELLLMGNPLDIVFHIVSGLSGIGLLASALTGHLHIKINMVLRIFILLAAVALMMINSVFHYVLIMSIVVGVVKIVSKIKLSNKEVQ